MKRLYILTVLSLWLTSCSKDSLNLENPNEKGLETLKTEEGIEKFTIGTYEPLRYRYRVSNYAWAALTLHNLMGDATSAFAGNLGFRAGNTPYTITRPNGTVVPSTLGASQATIFEIDNTRDKGEDNGMHNEWSALYGLIGHCNVALQLLNNNEVAFQGADANTKLKTYKAWYLWWKGFAYSRLGSLYSKAVITNQYNQLSNNYQPRENVIAEATRLFTEAQNILSTISESDATYIELFKLFVPSHFQVGKGGVLSPQTFIRQINTYKARNILVNKYATDLTAADLAEIEQLCNNGIQANDVIFTMRAHPDASLCFVATDYWSPSMMTTTWEYPSERWVQDFKAGDNRFTRNLHRRSEPYFNPRGRGLSLGTRYEFVDGADYASSTPGQAEMPFACTYEENQLMLAEVKIRQGNTDAGLAHIDAVRNYQNAQLAAVAGTGLSQAQALEELRRERRIGLFLKGTPFYDARRWGLLKPLAQGGGRHNAIVLVEADGTIESCTIDYQYKEWFDVPASETDFNPLR